MASFDVTLPDSLAFSSADENASYLTFHQLLLNDAGYDLTPYLGETVTVHIDAVYEGVNRVTWMPSDEALLVDGLGVTIAMRAITLELNGEIIGAYLSAGRHSTEFALSLQGSSPQAC